MEEYLLLIFLAAVAVLFIFYLVLYRKFLFLSRRYQEFMVGGNGESLEGTLENLFADIRMVNESINSNRKRMEKIEKVLDTATRGIGVVRFNAFQETGSDLSFAVAYLDAQRNGVVISSIYGREESRTYAKPVKNGESTYQLSMEEQEAIRQAAASLQPLSIQEKT
ncbi:DUF4446 family protein [Dethiobacter alkaliphilus]|uniref:DUF4446 domain-containing protein n=1 Tax=Dethiobacter alkaliphilus AHT 1 TaxID=555088 RepID=C0GI84_DETAL|nr:DUF4446 family protein [Dethiobacter alkaliphilus]EEG76932.1 conserved hypothetical protein [Dethiobacter alkaliphilus AHT 1]